MQKYHLIWLANHPHRSAEWLKERLADGFDLHHKDGDHSNNEPNNLCLIEATDHMRLHGFALEVILATARANRKAARHTATQERIDICRQCYEAKTSTIAWSTIGAKLNPTSQNSTAWARSAAKKHAADNGLPFPKPGSSIVDHVYKRKRIPVEARKAAGL